MHATELVVFKAPSRAPFIVFVTAFFLLTGLHAMAAESGQEIGALQDAGLAAMQQHNYSDAVTVLGNCVELASARADRATCLAAYGIALHRAGRNIEAKRALEQALAVSDDIAGKRAGRAVAINSLVSVSRSLGDYEGAERVLRDAIADPAASQDERAIPMVILSGLLREEMRLSEANEILDEAAGQLSAISWHSRIEVLMESAETNREMHLWDASIASWNEVAALAASEHALHYDAIIAGGLGETWLWAGNLARAEPLLRRSLQLQRDDPDTTPAQVAKALAALAQLYADENKLVLAENAVTEAIAKDESTLGPSHPQLVGLLELDARILSSRGETQEALDNLERARVIVSSNFGPDSSSAGVVYTAMGDVEQRAHQPAAAAVHYGRAMQRFLQAGADSAMFASTILARYTSALKAAHRSDEAKAIQKNFNSLTKKSASNGKSGK